MSSEVAKELALDQGEKKEALGAGGRVSVSSSKVNSIAVESAKLEKNAVELSPYRQPQQGQVGNNRGYPS